MIMKKTKRYSVGGEADDDAKSGIVTKFGKTPGGEDTFERDREVLKTQDSGPTRTSTPKANVTKEQLEKSGLSLRDYLNKQQGLTRRGDSTPRPEPKAPVKETVSDHLADEFKKRPAGTGMQESARQARVDRIHRNVGSNLENFGMKKGGKVSSASSRGDGIAQRGKTRGKMC
jgi:hypothetical protein